MRNKRGWKTENVWENVLSSTLFIDRKYVGCAKPETFSKQEILGMGQAQNVRSLCLSSLCKVLGPQSSIHHCFSSSFWMSNLFFGHIHCFGFGSFSTQTYIYDVDDTLELISYAGWWMLRKMKRLMVLYTLFLLTTAERQGLPTSFSLKLVLS